MHRGRSLNDHLRRFLYSRSAKSQDFTELFMAVMSPTLRSTDPHLNQTLERMFELMDQGRMVRAMNLPAFQLLMVLDTLF